MSKHEVALMKEHEMKIAPVWFDAVSSGAKRFELRKDDRGVEVGDMLVLREYQRDEASYTGRSVRRRVTYVLRDVPKFGLQPGYAIIGLATDTRERQVRALRAIYVEAEGALARAVEEDVKHRRGVISGIRTAARTLFGDLDLKVVTEGVEYIGDE